MSIEGVREGILFTLGNPLLDITARPEKEFLSQYGLEPNNAILAAEKHVKMYEEMKQKYPIEYSAGGSVLNTARVFQWLIGKPKCVTYTGCIGKDEFGKILTTKSQDGNVNVQFMLHDSEQTGKCAVLVTGTNRSLCAYLGAAQCFQKSHLLKPEVDSLVRQADYFYIEGYHLAVSPESILHLANIARENNKVFAMNLNAAYLVTVFKEPMMSVLPYTDVLFSNETEAVAFAEEHKFGTQNLEEIALLFSKLPKANNKRERITIITQACLPVIVAINGKTQLFPVTAISSEMIVDTNGAGDAFAGGFLSMYIQQKSIDVCIKCGIYAAGEIIQREGCTVPSKVNFNPEK